jgi:hypothetical protein
MIRVVLLAGEIALLFLLSHVLLQRLYDGFLLLTKSRSIAISAVTIILFPGTVVHELSHLFVAEILGVRAGDLSLTPEIPSRDGDEHVKAGSVAIAKTGPFRRAVIGIAPIIVGLGALSALSFYLSPLVSRIVAGDPNGLFSNPSFYIFVIAFYVIFAVSNTMFSSPEDLRGFMPVAVSILVLAIVLSVLGLRISLTGQVQALAERVIYSLSQSLGIVLAINCIILITTTILVTLIGKVTHRHVV